MREVRPRREWQLDCRHPPSPNEIDDVDGPTVGAWCPDAGIAVHRHVADGAIAGDGHLVRAVTGRDHSSGGSSLLEVDDLERSIAFAHREDSAGIHGVPLTNLCGHETH